MNRETLDLGTATADVFTVDSVIYVHVSGVFDDRVAMGLLRHMDGLIDRIPGDPIRVWDASGIPTGAFRLTSEGIDAIADWSRRLKARRPGATAYMIGSTAVSYGMARMYQMKAGPETNAVTVLRSLDDLPPEVRAKIPPPSGQA